MSVLYVTQPDAILNKSYEAFIVKLKQPDGSWKKQTIPAQTVEQVVLMGNPQVTGDALMYALELGMPVHYLSGFGKHLGSALPAYSRNGQLRLAQYRLYEDQGRKLELVKAIVYCEAEAARWVLEEANDSRPDGGTGGADGESAGDGRCFDVCLGVGNARALSVGVWQAFGFGVACLFAQWSVAVGAVSAV